jgi:hypothetical protein
MGLTLVDPTISRAKLARELAQWETNLAARDRGWILLSHEEAGPTVEVAFLTRIAISTGGGPLPVVACAIRLLYDNYDLWPPSLTFIDAVSRQPMRPHVRAFLGTPEGPRDVLIDAHPLTGQPFLCLPGIREYHNHPQHTGDDWLLHRSTGSGSLVNVCERVWRLMSRNVVGLNFSMQALPTWPLKAQIAVQMMQGDIVENRAPAPVPDVVR